MKRKKLGNLITAPGKTGRVSSPPVRLLFSERAAAATATAAAGHIDIHNSLARIYGADDKGEVANLEKLEGARAARIFSRCERGSDRRGFVFYVWQNFRNAFIRGRLCRLPPPAVCDGIVLRNFESLKGRRDVANIIRHTQNCQEF